MRNLFFSLIAFAWIPGILLGNDNQGSEQRDYLVYEAPTFPYNSVYATPTEINFGKPCDTDFFIAASFLYWQFQMDNLAVGLVQDSSSVTTTPNSDLSNHFIQMSQDFKPGFQVSLGMNLLNNDWEGLATYTRVHGSNSVSSNGSDPDGISIYVTDRLQSIFPPEMGVAIDGSFATVTPAYTSLSSTYRSNLDFIDAEIANAFCIGKSLTLRTAMGLRSAWIFQSLNSTYAVAVDPTTARQLVVKSDTHSWGFGPRFGSVIDWTVGKGFSLMGSVYGDILYTWYNVKDKTSVTFLNPQFASSRDGVDSNTFTTSDRPKALRAHIDLEMGIQWGCYFCDNDYHVDLSATYGFQVFFDQNMFRHWDGLLPAWSTAPHGNLYVNGLTFNATFDF